MKNRRQTLRKIVGHLNNADEDGGFWLPNIQRPFVWTEEQACRLFDSILREYPIGTLLIWRTTSGIRRRKFIENWKSSLRLSDFNVPEDTGRKNLVLDGQQRLQSLFIGLAGSFEGRELYFHILSGSLAAPDDVRFKFKFLSAEDGTFPWVKFKDLVFTSKKKREVAEGFEETAGRAISETERDKISDHLDLIERTFKSEEGLTYQELDSIDNPKLYTEDDVVEIFIRANSGGTRLGKSDLLFSLLSASWDLADEKMEDLLDSLNRHGFAFDRDFVLKTCLVLLDQGARYEVEKFRKPGLREQIEERWEDIAAAVRDVLDFVRGRTFIQCDKALPTYLVLIPLVYLRFHFPASWRGAAEIDTYLLRASLAGAFGGQPDSLIDALVSRTRELQAFSLDEAFAVMRNQGRSLELTEEKLWQMGYGSETIHLLFNLWYRQFNHTPAYDNNLPQIDHIFPQSELRRIRVENPTTGRRDILRYREKERNQLANCMLLTREENGTGGKGTILPDVWFSDKPAEYLNMHLIPHDPSLWSLDRFNEFIEARRALIRNRFESILVPSVAADPA